MSSTCGVCSGAIPDGETVDGHTALCAEVVRARSEARVKELEDAIRNAGMLIKTGMGGNTYITLPPMKHEHTCRCAACCQNGAKP
jgi:hypothetical protein